VPDDPPTLVPGLYFSCKAQINDPGPSNAVRAGTLRLFCYSDSPGINVNNHVPGAVGDGLGGVAPPPPFAEVHASHASGPISINASSALSFTSGICIDNPHSQLGVVYVVPDTIADMRAGQVSTDADIWINQPGGCAGSPVGAAFQTNVQTDLSRQSIGLVFDSDKDNCADAEELSDAGATGGLRDPFNSGDFMSVHTGPVANLQKDQVVSVADISAVVARFGTNDSGGTTKINRNTNPKSGPPATGYHPSFDRGGPIPNGGVAGSVSRQTPASVGAGAGSITVADISATVAQFGHSCAAAP
jgi:hypothetical protein